MKGLFDFKEILPVYMWDQALYKSKIKYTGDPSRKKKSKIFKKTIQKIVNFLCFFFSNFELVLHNLLNDGPYLLYECFHNRFCTYRNM
jgi:hypothetical protein